MSQRIPNNYIFESPDFNIFYCCSYNIYLKVNYDNVNFNKYPVEQ